MCLGILRGTRSRSRIRPRWLPICPRSVGKWWRSLIHTYVRMMSITSTLRPWLVVIWSLIKVARYTRAGAGQVRSRCLASMLTYVWLLLCVVCRAGNVTVRLWMYHAALATHIADLVAHPPTDSVAWEWTLHTMLYTFIYLFKYTIFINSYRCPRSVTTILTVC